MTVDVEVLVIGAGACGIAAAIAAHDRGMSVALVEKLDRPGGNSALSTGSVPAAGSRFQREAGIDDDAERFFRDLMSIAPETDDAALVKRLTQVSAETVEWLVDHVEAKLSLVTAYKHIGHSVPRLHAPVSRKGQDLVDDLLRAADMRGIPLAVGNSVSALLTEDNRVVGARTHANGKDVVIKAAKTILAVNGFGGNAELVRRFCPEIAGAQYFGAPGSTGEAITWGEALGADFANMEAYQGYAAVAYPHGSLLSWTTIEKGGVLIGADGRRFGNEATGYSGYAKTVLKQAEPVFAIFDQRIFDIAAAEEEFVELSNHGGFKRATSAEELAAALRVRAENLARELEDYNAAAQGSGRDRFGRSDFGIAPLKPGLFGCRVIPGLFHTQGGLRIDGDARVLRKDGSPIANLFAGGGAAAGISGRSGALGYASGNGLLTAIALGRIAGLAAAAEIAAER
jgi:fumarate reductase flavoprotein subunit